MDEVLICCGSVACKFMRSDLQLYIQHTKLFIYDERWREEFKLFMYIDFTFIRNNECPLLAKTASMNPKGCYGATRR